MDKQNSLIDSKVFDDLFLKEQVKVLYEGLGSSVIGTLVISTVIYFSNPVMTGVNENAMNWVFLIWIVAILRGIDALFYKKSKLESRSSTSYLARLAIGALMGAASWSILFWNTFPGSSFEFQVYMILVVTGIASFAATTLSYHLGIILGYLAIAMLPMEILILMESSVFYTPLAVLLPLYLVFQVSGAKRISKNYRHNISLQIEFKLKEKEYMNLQYAVDQHNIVSVSDTNGKIEYANHSLEEISQYSRQELLGNDHGISSSGYHSTSFWKEMWASITSGKVWHGEVKNAAKDGSTYWVESTIVPFVDDHGKPEKYITIRTDITNPDIS
jgi:PAS domain S-box-containing protein